jgi:hypothetical protein
MRPPKSSDGFLLGMPDKHSQTCLRDRVLPVDLGQTQQEIVEADYRGRQVPPLILPK